ncbi:MAG: hypothetical protein U1F66_09415 [bacterium]
MKTQMDVKRQMSLLLLISFLTFLPQFAEAGTVNVLSALTKRASESRTALTHPFWKIRLIGRSGGAVTMCQGDPVGMSVGLFGTNDPNGPHMCDFLPDQEPTCKMSEVGFAHGAFLHGWEFIATINGESYPVMKRESLMWEYLQNPNAGPGAVQLTCDQEVLNATGAPRTPEQNCDGVNYLIDLSEFEVGSYTIVTDLYNTVVPADFGTRTRVVNVVSCP